ncbi:MAG: dihydropteroate synthase [Bacteroidaceae bacterium]|nr:dihydropteroate synthase [Bacteroidaceae bacterium]
MVREDKLQIMGILNVTPDSFYPESRKQTEKEIGVRAEEIFEHGGDIIDVGAVSTRPGASTISEEEEEKRLTLALNIIRSIKNDAVISVDTTRASIARFVVEEMGVSIINDISGGQDNKMFTTISALHIPYILTSNSADIKAIKSDFEKNITLLNQYGHDSIILDPGFGFGKTLEDNFHILNNMEDLHTFGLPILVGLSRKSMIYNTLHCTPNEALNGTTVLNTIALCKGASILRVHDVREAAEVIKLYQHL